MLRYLNFLDTTIELDLDPAAGPAFRPAGRFFRHLIGDRPAAQPAFRVHVLPLTAGAPAPRGRPVTIRRSSAAEFTFEAQLSREGDRWIYAGENTRLNAPADALTDPEFEIAITGRSAVQVIDFLRDLIIRREETLGTVVLHASAVRRDGDVFAIAGPKGAGKTTTLLSILRQSGWRYFTGDKLFCRPDGGHIAVHAWRDYPYVGVGTLRANPDLGDRVRDSTGLDLAGLDARHKILLDPDLFESWLGSEFSAGPGRLAGILLPRVMPGEPLTVTEVTEPGARWSALNTIVDRSVDTTFFGWQHYLVPDYEAFYRTLARLRPELAGLVMLRLEGTLDVDLDAVLKEARP